MLLFLWASKPLEIEVFVYLQNIILSSAEIDSAHFYSVLFERGVQSNSEHLLPIAIVNL